MKSHGLSPVAMLLSSDYRPEAIRNTLYGGLPAFGHRRGTLETSMLPPSPHVCVVFLRLYELLQNALLGCVVLQPGNVVRVQTWQH